jgi:hypothetical protein
MSSQKGCLPEVRRVSARVRRGRTAPSSLIVALAVAGCTTVPPIENGAGPAAATAVALGARAVPDDPLLAFVAGAGPGSESIVNGERVRVARAYAAASGRECREILVGAGVGERSALVCQDPLAGWMHARPLLRGSGLGRP